VCPSKHGENRPTGRKHPAPADASSTGPRPILFFGLTRSGGRKEGFPHTGGGEPGKKKFWVNNPPAGTGQVNMNETKGKKKVGCKKKPCHALGEKGRSNKNTPNKSTLEGGVRARLGKPSTKFGGGGQSSPSQRGGIRGDG